MVVPGLGRSLFCLKQTAWNGVGSALDMDIPTLEKDSFAVPLQHLRYNLYPFSVGPSDGSDTIVLAIQASTNTIGIGD